MKTGNYLKLILMSVLTLLCVSCNDDDEDNTLRFSESIVNNTLEVLYPSSDPEGSVGAVTILGGDANYTIYCDKPSVLTVNKKFPNAFILYPQDWGEANVIVVDGTGKAIVLKVSVNQQHESSVVTQRTVRIVGGEALTTEQQAQIREEALSTIPVLANGGGYEMIGDDPTCYSKGSLTIYPREFGKQAEAIKTTFAFVPFDEQLADWKPTYVFTIDGEERRFYSDIYFPENTRMSVAPPLAWVEDVTERIQSHYAGVKVYTQQVWVSK